MEQGAASDNSHKTDVTMASLSSNAVRLSSRQWLVVGAVMLALIVLAPTLWTHIERFTPESDYRIPYALSSDYWLYGRYAELACAREKIPVIGDSVIWGHYVRPDQTLSHYLNEAVGSERFANLGLDGTHPAALQGLIKYYASDMSGRPVVVQFNPLWMSSPKHDLQTSKEFHFNHPKLVPQFRPKIPCYRAPFSTRLWAVTENHLAFFSWTAHLKTAYLQGMDLPTWTQQNPYQIPLAALTGRLPGPEKAEPEKASSWLDRSARKRSMAWVELDASLQWAFFKQAVQRLKSRGNTVFVLVGPFNEHMLDADSLTQYGKIKSGIEAWLRKNDIPHSIASPLPSAIYCDSSHPVAEGYALLARQLLANPRFGATMLDRGCDSE